MANSGIYKIANKLNGKCYVGSAINLRRRWLEHRALLRRGIHHSKHLQRAWNTHGEDAFVFEVVEQVEKPLLIEREQYWINTCHAYGRNGYNVSPTAASSLGITRSDETRRKISQAKRGSKPWNHGIKTGPQSPELVERRVAPTRGISRPDEVKKAISERHKASGHKPTPEALAISAEKRKRNAELRRAGLLPPQYDEERRKAVGAAISAAKRAAKEARMAAQLLTC